MYIRAELSRIIINEATPQQIIFLKEKGGERSFPIMIGVAEALAIDRRLKGVEMPRPMTHDLLAEIIKALGGSLQKVLITDLRQHTFFATLVIERDGQTLEIDSRPSDAIALGVAFDTPIFVAEGVFDEVLSDAMDLAGNRQLLEARRGQLADEITDLQRRLDESRAAGQVTGEQADEVLLRLREIQAEMEAIDELLRHMQ